jgi:hypothetical protein
LERTVLDGRVVGKDRVFLTTHKVVRVGADGKEIWAIPLDTPDRLEDGRLVDVPGDGLLCFRYCPISDSGVKLMRFEPRTGKKLWTADCAPLGVSHSEYLHQAAVALDGQQVRVTSRASSGSFVELLDLQTGKRLGRQKRGAGD